MGNLVERSKHFRVGDRVRYTGNETRQNEEMIGQLGTVRELPPKYQNSERRIVRVSWDSPGTFVKGVWEGNLEFA